MAMVERRTEARAQLRMVPGRRAEDLQLAKQVEQGKLFQALIDSACDGIVGLALDGSVMTWSRGAEKLLGYSGEEATGTGIAQLLKFDHDWWNGGISHWEGSQRGRTGQQVELAIESSPVLDESQEKSQGFVWIMRDVTAQVRSAYLLQMRQDQLHEEARTDPLTGAANRRRLEEMLHAEMSRARRHSTSLSLLLIDLDHLKAVNDQHSHVVGDAALKVFAKTIQTQLRACDLLARLGGDEFVVLMPETGRAEADICAARLRAALDKATVSNLPRKLTASLGIAVFCGEESADTLLHRADQALYEAKQKGRDCAVHWEDIAVTPPESFSDARSARQYPSSTALLLQAIEHAIRDGRPLRLNCRNYCRMVIPQVLEGDAADPVLVAWQTSGGCETNVTTGLKRFRLSEIRGLSRLPLN